MDTPARSPTYRARLADRRLVDLLGVFSAVLINGPRAVGKTTTARQVAASVVRLDDPREAAAFDADPDAALRLQREPVLLDEWQEVPALLGAVKRAVDDDPRPGRFVLTGSVRGEVEQRVWPGTGRLLRMAMYGLTEAELGGMVGDGHRGFLERLALADPSALPTPAEQPDLLGYVALAVRGGFPDVVLRQLGARDRNAWLDSYIGNLLGRDAVAVDPRRDVGKMRTYFEALAVSTAGMPHERTLADAAGIDVKTARGYDKLLEDLFVTEQIPAWSTNRLSRLVHSPKRYIVDTGLAARAARLTEEAILRDGDLLGRAIDGFAVAQLRSEMAASPDRYRAHHLRTQAGRQEVDLVVELDSDRVLALEFKATAAPSGNDARHLIWLRDELGERFVAGAVMHTGPHAFQLADRILAVPLCAMWG
jgi:predicted AAA+ superfamily ATPase